MCRPQPGTPQVLLCMCDDPKKEVPARRQAERADGETDGGAEIRSRCRRYRCRTTRWLRAASYWRVARLRRYERVVADFPRQLGDFGVERIGRCPVGGNDTFDRADPNRLNSVVSHREVIGLLGILQDREHLTGTREAGSRRPTARWTSSACMGTSSSLKYVRAEMTFMSMIIFFVRSR